MRSFHVCRASVSVDEEMRVVAVFVGAVKVSEYVPCAMVVEAWKIKTQEMKSSENFLLWGNISLSGIIIL